MSLHRIGTVFLLTLGCLLAWQGVILLTGAPHFILPGPKAVALAMASHQTVLLRATFRTAIEIISGFAIGAVIGAALAVAMAAFPRLARALRPALLFSQVIPIFALAPLLTLWLGYGMAPKITVTALICFFPVVSAFLDGLLRTSPACVDLAQMCCQTNSNWSQLWLEPASSAGTNLPPLSKGGGAAGLEMCALGE